jgi:hypothetical protein
MRKEEKRRKDDSGGREERINDNAKTLFYPSSFIPYPSSFDRSCG